MADFDDYESLPTHSLWIHLTAGALAGVGEHCTMYPVDLVKTRMQSLCSQCPERECRTPVSGLVSVAKREGLIRSFRGVSVIAAGAVPAHALYFTVYEKLRHFLVGGTTGHHFIATGTAGVAATLCHDAVMNPAEVVKQRMQMFCCPYASPSDCARCVLKHEGVLAFYRSYPTQLVMNVPFHAIHFMVYEGFQSRLNPTKKYDPLSHAVSGAAAGGLAAAVTTPLDVCKTVLNTQERLFVVDRVAGEAEMAAGGMSKGAVSKYFLDIQNRQYSHLHAAPKASETVSGFSQAVRSIFVARGWTGFFGGLQARVLFQMPGTAIAWSVYELFKYLLHTEKLPCGDIPSSASSFTADGSELNAIGNSPSSGGPVHGHPIT